MDRIREYLESKKALDKVMLEMYGHKRQDNTKFLVTYYTKNDPNPHYKWVWPEDVVNY